MSLTYGPWEYAGGNGMRVGIDPSTATVTHTSTSVVVTYLVYTENQHNYDDFQTLTFGGSYNGAATLDYNNQAASGSGAVLRATKTYTYTYPGGSFGSSPATLTFSTTVSGAYNAVSPSHSVTVTIPARPYGAPAAPTAAAVARVSDTKQTVTWTNNATAGEPYTNVEVWRSTDGGAYVQIATVGAVATYSDATTTLGHRYQYRVRATNPVGQSAYAMTGTVDTTPPAPGTPTAVKQATGDIVVTWTNTASWTAGVEVWHAANGVWDASPLVTLGVVTSYSHTSPSASVTHTYRLRNVGSGGLTSAYSGASNVVQLLTAPLAPTALSPSSVARDARIAIDLSWQYNSADTTAQKKFEIQYRVDGGAWTSMGAITSASTLRTIVGGTWTNGTSLEWQVRTWGSYVDPSPWSTSALITLSTPPVVTITSPESGPLWATSKLTATWSYYDADGTAQSAWYATLRTQSGVGLEYKSGSGTATTATFAYALANLSTYRVDVAVKDSAGMLASQSRIFSVSYALPMVPSLAVDWRPEEAATYLTVTTPATVSPAVDTDHVEVWRSVDGGVTWALVDPAVSSGATVVDAVPPLGVPVSYRAVAVSAIPSVATSAPQTVQTDGCAHVWLNAGPGFGTSVRLQSNVVVDIATTPDKTLRTFAGRVSPVEFSAAASSAMVRSRVVRIQAARFAPWIGVTGSSTWEDVEAIGMLPGPHCYRDPEGRRYFVSMAGAGVSGIGTSVGGMDFTLTEIDWSE